MINPTMEDIGRGVVYQASHPNAPREDGTITSFNWTTVFVRYKGDIHSKGTSRSDLVWLSGGDRKCPGCDVREPWDHRCHGEPCPCDCRNGPPEEWCPHNGDMNSETCEKCHFERTE